MKKNLLKKLELTTAGIISLGLGSVITTNTNWVQAANKNQTVTVKKNAKGYVYKNKSLSKVASKNVKKEFGNNKLVVKRLATIKRHGKKQQFDYLVDKVNHKKVGWVYDKSVQVNKAKKAKVSKKNYKKTSKKHEKGYSSDEIWKTLNEPQAGDDNSSSSNSNSGKDVFGEKIYSKDEFINQLENKFVSHVNEERQENGQEPFVKSSGLMRLAQERANYVDVNNDNAHNITSDGKNNHDMAAFIDGKSMGILDDNNDLSESLSTFTISRPIDEDELNNGVYSLNDLLDNDGGSNNGHRDILIGNRASGQKYYGIGFRLNNAGNNYSVTAVILQSDSNL